MPTRRTQNLKLANRLHSLSNFGRLWSDLEQPNTRRCCVKFVP